MCVCVCECECVCVCVCVCVRGVGGWPELAGVNSCKRVKCMGSEVKVLTGTYH